MWTHQISRAALAVALANQGAFAASSASSSGSGTGTAPSLTVSTAVASPSAGPQATLPAQVALPPKQAWCPSEIFCAGALLQTVNLAVLFTDPKTNVDKPTSKPPQQVLSDFAALTNSSNSSIPDSAIEQFVDQDFSGEGLELQAGSLPSFKPNPAFLNNVSDPLVKAFAQRVHSFWPDLARDTNKSALCDGKKCESSLIPLNHTFVVPGGRFREQYYWDSFWIIEGLLESELFDAANSTLQNFMDELDQFGFIPNGGRIYYLNRSQPPLFTQMLARYVEASKDRSILQRAVPLVQKELQWFKTNRFINVTSPTSKKTFAMAQYNVNNSAPRPESYLQDYLTANPGGVETINETMRSALYAELASGAETGWDYTVRWTKGASSNLTNLQVRSTVPVDLNSILYKNHILLAGFVSDKKVSDQLTKDAEALKEGILDLFWNSTKAAFYDFNIITQSQNTVFSAANFYPLWSGIVPPELAQSSEKAFQHFAGLNLAMRRYNGTFPSTFIESGQQWDAPNAWPPHQYIALQALRSLPANVTNTSLPLPQGGQNSFALVPQGQLGVEEAQLPGQPVSPGVNASSDVSVIGGENGTQVVNGGNSIGAGEGWASVLGRQLANRYVTSALCSWWATGGEIDGFLPRLSDAELNITDSVNNTGNMFEKFSVSDVNSAGRGGEYTVQAGFGWTNGALLWVASNYGKELVAPACPNLTQSVSAITGSGGSQNSSGGGNTTGSTGSAPSDGTIVKVPVVLFTVAAGALVLAFFG